LQGVSTCATVQAVARGQRGLISTEGIGTSATHQRGVNSGSERNGSVKKSDSNHWLTSHFLHHRHCIEQGFSRFSIVVMVISSTFENMYE
jgi:hypothetical protein